MKINTDIEILKGDCLRLLEKIPEKSIDMILCDLPYGTTKNKWDKTISLEKLWIQYKRIIKPKGAIILFSQSPFDKVLACSNLEMFRYEWIWEKTTATGFLNSNKAPLKAHENILVFYKEFAIYNPQKTKGHNPVHNYKKHSNDGNNYGSTKIGISGGGSTERFPRSVLKFKTDKQKTALHPTQKPVALCEYLIRTYTIENMLVLDNCMGSGTTGVACINTGRRFIGMELDESYFTIAKTRVENTIKERAYNLFYEYREASNK